MPLKYRIADYPDISKGMIDKKIDGQNGRAELIENFVPTSERVLKTVDGYSYKYVREAIAPINFVTRLEDDGLIIFTRSNRLYALNETTGLATQIPTPNGVDLFSSSDHPVDSDDVVSYVKSHGRVMVTNNAGSIPMIVMMADMYTSYDPYSTLIPNSDVLRAIRAGLPDVSGTPAHNGTGTGSNWRYRFHYSIVYRKNGVINKIVGPTTEVVADDVATGVTLSGWTNPTNDMRVDEVYTQLEIYRTKHNGPDFYYLTSFAINGFLSFQDNISDTTLTANGSLLVYDNDSSYVPHYPAPSCKALAINGDTVYYLNVSEDVTDVWGTVTYNQSNQFVQGTTGAFGSCDLEATENLADEVIGGSSHNGKMVVFTKSYIYRIEGTTTQLGAGFIRPIIISRSVGLLGSNGAVETSKGIMFIGNIGPHVTDGFSVNPIDVELSETFASMFKPELENEKMYGTYDTKKELVYWLVSNDLTNDLILVFSLITGGFTIIKPRAMESRCLYQDGFSLLRGEYDGNIYNHAAEHKGFIQPIYSGLGALIRTKKYAIPFKFKGIIDGLGMPMIRKWGKKLNLTLESETDVCVGVKSNNDDGRASKEVVQIRHYGSWVWRDEAFFWKNPDTEWRRPATISSSRHFPKKSLRFRRKQIEIYAEEAVIFKSDLFGQATCVLNVINPAVPRRYEITLDSGDDWPDEILDYTIRIGDDYAVIDEIIGKKIITYGTQFPNSASVAWEIWGINKNQEVTLHAYSFTFAPLKEMGDNYQKEDSGTNE